MHGTVRYTLLYAVLVILQVFILGRMGFSSYVNPLVYISFIIMLPMETRGVALLAAGLFLGVTMDFFWGMAGVNTIATLFAAFVRPALLNYLVGKDEVKDGGIPNVARIGLKKFMRYAVAIILIHGTVFFFTESLAFVYWYHILMRTVLSSAACIIIVYFVQKFLSGGPSGMRPDTKI